MGAMRGSGLLLLVALAEEDEGENKLDEVEKVEDDDASTKINGLVEGVP
jgi:hypothetical protein